MRLARLTGRCRRTRPSLARISSRRTSPATQGASSNYKNRSTSEPPDHAIGRSRGGLSTKVHQLVDGRGLPLVIAVTAGQAGDSPMLLPLLAELQVSRAVGRPRTSPDSVRGDKVYSSRAIRTHLRDRGITASSPSQPTSRATASGAAHAAADPSATTPPTTSTAT